MKSLIFDAGPIISLATNNLLGILEPLKKKFNGNFYITEGVKRELVDKPFEIRKFKFEAIQVEKLIEDGILEIYANDFVKNNTTKLLDTANQIFRAYNNYMKIVQYGEMSVVAAAKDLNAVAIVVDEKTTRFLIENPKLLVKLLSRTLHTNIEVNESNLKDFRNFTEGMKTIRSVELCAVAYEQGMLDMYVTKMPDAKKNLLESVLWGVKLNGCAVSQEEIDDLIKMQFK